MPEFDSAVIKSSPAVENLISQCALYKQHLEGPNHKITGFLKTPEKNCRIKVKA